jgi:hypothetical protein
MLLIHNADAVGMTVTLTDVQSGVQLVTPVVIPAVSDAVITIERSAMPDALRIQIPKPAVAGKILFKGTIA